MTFAKRSELLWLVVLVAVYVFGNWGALLLVSLMGKWLFLLVYVAVLPFTIVLLVEVWLIVRSRLLARESRLRSIAIAIVALYSVTWLFVMYVYIKNFFWWRLYW